MDRAAKVCECGDHGFVKLSKWHTALFDPCDLPKIEGFTWSVDARRRRAYAIRAIGPRKRRRFVYMHRVVMDAPNGMDVDHISQGDATDNRRSNLRIVSRSENNADQRAKGGKSRFKGVYFHTQAGKWGAQICCRGKRKSLGLYHDEADAARAYDAAAIAAHGEIAATNQSIGLFEE